VRYCQTASPDALEARLKSLAGGTIRFACINYLEAIVAKVPGAMGYLSEATGPAAPFEEPAREIYAPQLRRRPRVRLGSTFVESAREMFAKWGGGREEKTASGVSPAAGAHSGEASMAADSKSAAGSSPKKSSTQRGVATHGRDELTSTR